MSHYSPASYAHALIRAQENKLDREKETLLDRLIAMMHDNEDEKKIPATLRIILPLLLKEKKMDAARIVTSVELDEEEKTSFQKRFPAKSYAWEVNPAILGGMVVEQGTRLYQLSIQHLLKGFER